MSDETDAARIAELEDDNRRLRRLLDQRDAPGELRHRLRSTIGLLRSIIRMSADTGRDHASYVAHLQDRVDAISRAQALADQTGEVSLQTLLTDELLQYGVSEGERLLLSGPDMRLQPRAGQVFALAIHELAVNAVEHGALGADRGRVEVSWSVVEAGPERSVAFVWKELGAAARPAEPRHQGFGTEILTRMLPYELGAETQVGVAHDGWRCTVRFPAPERVGRIVAE